MRRRRRRRKNNRHEEEEEENIRILWPENLYKCATFYLFLSLHFAPAELT